MEQARTFRIFVSSTFSDLKEERNALQRYVFPRLRDLCMQHGCRFQAIDLRWGVSEEAGRDQQTMKICLEEIARCQETKVRPNFIVLLGDRYGWCPLPSEIPKIEFDQIIKKITDDDGKKLIAQWYKCDENADPPVYCLKEREVKIAENATDKQKKKAQEREYEEWNEKEKKLRSILIRAIDQLGWQKDDSRRVKYEASATEQEINQGALKPQDAQKHVFCFFRTINGLPQDISAKDFHDIDDNGNLDKIAQSQLKNLKTRLFVQLPGNVLEYDANWTDKGLSTDHIGTLPEKLEDCLKLSDSDTIPSGLCGDVWRKLSKVINEEIASFEHVEALENEIKNHNEFGEERTRFFVGRDSTLKKISDHVKGTDTHPLAVFGVSGSGKSALMARAVEQAQSEHKYAVVIVRFIGATPESSDGRALLESMCQQISRGYKADESTVPNDYTKLVEEFPKRLSLATSEKPLFIFLDALDQLSNTDNANSLIWMPRELPPHVHLVVSTLHGEEKKLPSSVQIELEKMLRKDGNELLDLWMKNAKRSLQETQKKEVLNKFEKSGLPLYLKLAFEKARRWKSYDGIPFGSNGKQGLSQDIPGIIRDMFSRLSSESNHGKMLVSHSMGYLAASKNGLTEDEMIDVLSQDDELYQDFLKRTYHKPPEQRLPVVVWSRLFFDIEPYLTERSADGTTLLAFYHRQLGEVVRKEYLAGEAKYYRHHGLAQYFADQPLWIEREDKRIPHIRKVSEQPYQQTCGEMWLELEITLTDLRFIEAKCTAGMTYDLVADYRTALAKQGVPEGKLDILENFSRFVRARSHRIAIRPDLVVQEAYNFEAFGHVFEHAEQTIRDMKSALSPWLRLVNRSVEIFCLQTLEGHTGEVNAVAVTPDGRMAVTGSRDETIKLWDMTTGACLHTLEGHTSEVNAVAVISNGRKVVTGSRDKTIKLWDMTTGACLHTLEGHTSEISAIAVPNDGDKVVIGSLDDTINVWDLATLTCLQTLLRHENSIEVLSNTPNHHPEKMGNGNKLIKVWKLGEKNHGAFIFRLDGYIFGAGCVAITPDGHRAVTGLNWENTVKVWDLTTMQCFKTLVGHQDSVYAVAVTPNGKRAVSVSAVSASKDERLKVWDIESGKELRSLIIRDQNEWIESIALTPDGHHVLTGGEKTIKLWDLETGSCEKILKEHDDSVLAMAVTPDGRMVVTGSRDKTIKVWCLETGACLHTLIGHKDFVNVVIVTPDGRKVVTGSRDYSLLSLLKGGHFPTDSAEVVVVKRDVQWDVDRLGRDYTIKVWDLETGTCLNSLRGFCPTIHTAALTPDGLRVVTMKGHKLSLLDKRIDCLFRKRNNMFTVEIWDLETGASVLEMEGRKYGIRTVAVTSDGRQAITGSKDDTTFRVWDLTTGTCLRTLDGHINDVSAVAVTPDDRKVVTGSLDETIKVWDLTTGVCLQSMEGHTSEVSAVAITPDGKRIVSGSKDRTIKVWDLATGDCLLTLRGHSDAVLAVTVTPSGQQIVSGSEDKTVKVWELKSKASLQAIMEPLDSEEVLALAIDGGKGVTRGIDNIIKIWDISTGECLLKLNSDSHEPVVLMPDGHHVLIGGERNIKLWNFEAGSCEKILEEHTDRINTMMVTPDGKLVVAGGGESEIPGEIGTGKSGDVRVWDLISGACLHTLVGHNGVVNHVVITPDGRWAVTGGDDSGAIEVWDLATGECLRKMQGPARVQEMVLMADGRRVIAGYDTSVKIWDLVTGECQRTLEVWYNGNEVITHDGLKLKIRDMEFEYVDAIAVTPDGLIAVTGSRNKTSVKMWDLVTGECLRTLEGHDEGINAIAVTPDGHMAVTGSHDKTVMVWDLATGKEVACFFTDDPIGTIMCCINYENHIIASGYFGGIYILTLENVVHGPPVFTAWLSPTDSSYAFGCPLCRTWSEISASALGTELPCPHCGKSIKLNPFTINADWRPVAKAWRGGKD